MFSLITIIGGGGQTGQLFIKEIASKVKNVRIEAVVRQGKRDKLTRLFPNSVTISSDIRISLRRKPDVIILATPNPTEEVLKIIAEEVKKPVIVVLPQNGVNVVPTAEKIFKERKISNIYLVRASLFTTVSLSSDGKAVYNADKLRIALSPVSDGDNLQEADSYKPHPTLLPRSGRGQALKGEGKKVSELFEKAGFEVALFDNYKSMEMTKLIVNGLGSTAAITGFALKETFEDEQLFELEMRALKDRLTIMKAENIPFAKIPWSNIRLVPAARIIPTKILKKVKGIIAEFITKGRENISPAAARKITQGRTTELAYYHKPFLDLGRLHSLRSPVDETIFEIITEHERGIINLASLTKEKRKDILFKAYKINLQKSYISRDPFKTSIIEKLLIFFSQELVVTGIENLEIVRENLKRNKSVVLLANHLSHADHPTLAIALRRNGFNDLAERLTFVAGMRFKDEFIAKIFNDAYARISVSTPTSSPQTDEENRESQRINLKGFFEASRLLNKGNLLVIYPEGTRSRGGKLLKAIPTVTRYLENPNIGVILPVAIQGTKDLLPAGKKIMRFRKTKISFGKPILPTHLFNGILEGLTQDKRNKYKGDKKIRDEINEKIMDLIMQKISNLLPEEQRGVYK